MTCSTKTPPVRHRLLAWAILSALLGSTLGFSAEARTIHVDQRSPPGGDGSKALPLATISAAAEIAKGGDRIVVSAGTYYERPVFADLESSAERPVWIKAEEPGTVTISAMWQAAAEGRVAWRKVGKDVYAAPRKAPLFGHFEGTFLFRFNTVEDLQAARAGDVAMPPYGFGAEDGLVYVRLPDGLDPNGRSLKFSAKKASVLSVVNSSHVIIDGFRIEGAGAGRCIDFDAKSQHAIVRNSVLTACRHGVRLADHGLIEWSEYSYPGFRDFAEDIRQRNGSTTAVYDLVKTYHRKNWLEGGLAISFGRDHASRHAEFRYNFIHQTFDGEQLGQFEFSSSHHNVYMYNYDNHVEFENWAGHGARELRLHDSLLLAAPLGPISHQDVSRNRGMIGPHHVYRNVVAGFDAHGWDSWTVIKSKVENPSFEGLYYTNNLLWSDGRSPDDHDRNGGPGYLFWDDQRRDVFQLRNNIIIFNESNDNRNRGPFRADYNVYVNAVDMPWLRGPNGAYLGADPSVLRFNDVDSLNFGLRADSPALNVRMPGAKKGEETVNPGPFPAGFDPGSAWPRPRRTVFTTTKPTF